MHKIQGQTIERNKKTTVDLKSVFEGAQAYVMLTRVQELDQLYILEELPEDKIYASLPAQNEIERLTRVSINKNPGLWEIIDDTKIRLSFLNCRSMKNKFEHIATDESLMKSDVIMLSESYKNRSS